MRTFVHRDGKLPEGIDAALAHYRHQIFVEQLGWSLPMADDNFERDQYDREDTVYVVAHDEVGAICGCARLLPTTRPYLLKELFPFLLAEGMSGPESPGVWELSRFAASPVATGRLPQGNLAWIVRPMLASVVLCAAQLGARQLIGVTFLSMERLFRRIGIHAHPAGPAQCVDGRMVIACWIDIDGQTLAALGIDEATDASSKPIAPRIKAPDPINLDGQLKLPPSCRANSPTGEAGQSGCPAGSFLARGFKQLPSVSSTSSSPSKMLRSGVSRSTAGLKA